MKNIFVIASNTFREAIRDKILYAMLGFAVIFILIDLFMARVALGDLAMIRSFGLAGIYLFGLIITIFLGASIVYKEIERKTLYFVLSKPVSRFDVIMGKFLGLSAAVVLTTLLMAAVYLGVIAYEHGGFDALGLLSIAFQILEEELFIALLIFFSSIAAPLTSTLCAMMLLFMGHLLASVVESAAQIGGYTMVFIQGLYYLLPNLEKFNVRNLVVHNISVSLEAGLLTLGYAVIYTGLLLIAATLLFKKREI